jgi:hypothetical protein
MRSTVHNGRMTARNPDRDALRDAIALIRARTDTNLMLPQVLDANDDGTVTVDPTFVPNSPRSSRSAATSRRWSTTSCSTSTGPASSPRPAPARADQHDRGSGAKTRGPGSQLSTYPSAVAAVGDYVSAVPIERVVAGPYISGGEAVRRTSAPRTRAEGRLDQLRALRIR